MFESENKTQDFLGQTEVATILRFFSQYAVYIYIYILISASFLLFLIILDLIIRHYN